MVHRFSSCGTQAPERRGSVVMPGGLTVPGNAEITET